MGGLSRSWDLARASWQILLADRKLVLFPVLSGICTLLAAAVFVLPLAFAGNLERSIRADGIGPEEAIHLTVLFLFYLITSFITLFFNTALCGIVLDRLQGGQPTAATGFQVALKNVVSIVILAAISATVGLILQLIERRGNLVTEILASLLGAAWSIMTFLVVPVMIAEGRNPFAAIGRSTALLRQTWGAQITGNLGLGAVVFLLALPGVLPVGLGFISGSAALLVIGLVVSVVYWGLLAVISSALTQIFRSAVYLYATTGTVPAGFAPWMVENAFRLKEKKAAAPALS